MRVFPHPDGLCPSCRKFNFESAREEPIPAPIKRVTRQVDLSEGACLYWALLAVVAAQLGSLGLVGAVNWWAFGARWQRTAEDVLTFAHVAFGVGVVVFAYRLAKWLMIENAVWWAVGLFLPCIGLLVLFGLIRRATECFRAEGAPMGLLGPRLRDIRAAKGDVEGA